MRTYEKIYKDYCDWLYKKTGNYKVKYDVTIDRFSNIINEETEEPLGKEAGKRLAFAYFNKSLLKLVYNKNNGFYFFVKFIIGDLLELGFPKPLHFNNIMNKFFKLLKSEKKIAILCARGHGKSLTISVLYNLYDMFIHKHRKILLISASQEQSNRILLDVKNIVDNNEWLITKKSSKRWSVETIGYNSGYILVKGIGSEILGEHVNRIVLDDILASEVSKKMSDQQIEDYIDLTLDPMLLSRNGQMVLVGTTKTASDIFNTIKTRIAMEDGCPWKLYRFPAIIDFEKKVLQCPDRFTWEDIMSKRLSMGALKFSREYQLEFFSRDQSLFPKEYVKRAKEKGKDFVLLNKADKRNNEWSYCFGVDVARSGSISADYTVVIGLAYNSITQEKQIIHVWRSKGLKISEQAIKIAEISRVFDNPYFLVEKNNIGQDMIDELIDKHNLFVENFTTGGKGQKKEELIRFLVLAFEREQISMPIGNEESRNIIKILEEELEKFCSVVTPAGNEVYKGMSSHDDTVMALAIANRATQNISIPFAITSNTTKPMTQTSVYDSFLKPSSNESDIVNKIRLGLIK